MAKEIKTMREHLESGAKYSGSSVAVGYSIAKIIVFAFPQIQPVELEIAGIMTFVVNLILVRLMKN